MRLPTQLLRRKADSHKGDFGHIFILAGSARYSGAAVLCAAAAMRAGAGLVTIGVPKSLNNALIKIKPLEVMTLPLPETKEGQVHLSAYNKINAFLPRVDVLTMGPGLGRNILTKRLVLKLIGQIDKPLVIDADAINALAGKLKILRLAPSIKNGKPVVLTPHFGEMARLIGMRLEQIKNKRKNIAQKCAIDYNITLILKGSQTLVADASGKSYLNSSGNPGMATAGSGDVLTGIVAAFLGQGLDAFSAAKYAVYLHGLAGDLAAENKTQIGLIASDIIANIPAAIKLCH